MTYRTIVIDYTPKAKKMAAAVEQAADVRLLGRYDAAGG